MYPIIRNKEKMAMVIGGIGSILASEIGKLVVEHSPLIKQVAQSAVVDVAKKSFDHILDLNPNFSNFLGAFGIHRFSPKKTISSRGRHKRMANQNNY
jgi:hypothetical protein